MSRAPHTKNCEREKGIYNLPNHFSIRELSLDLGISLSHVKDVLTKNRLIKYVQRYSNRGKKKYVLTDKGWQFGTMYDPSEEEFHGRDGKRIMTSNAQPVFTMDVLNFF